MIFVDERYDQIEVSGSKQSLMTEVANIVAFLVAYDHLSPLEVQSAVKEGFRFVLDQITLEEQK